MNTTLKITLKDLPDSQVVAIIEEENAEPLEYYLDDSSLSSLAWSVGNAVTDYLEGIG